MAFKHSNGSANKDKPERVAIIAGNGLLPIKVAESLSKQGCPPLVFPLKGEAHSCLYDYEHHEISVVSFGALLKTLRQADIKRIILAGGVEKRPLWSDIKLDWPTLRALPIILPALGKGDDAILRAFIKLLEVFGFQVIGAHEVVPDLLAPNKPMDLTKASPNKLDLVDIDLARDAALKLGVLDIGQGSVAVGGRVVALEGVEGTDLMLLRVAELRAAGRIPPRGGVLVKCAKPQQEERADLPAIGIMTVENVAAAGMSGIAVEAGRVFILGFEETIAEANRRGIFIQTIVPDN